MIEYLYDAIRATAGEKIELSAIIENAEGEPITGMCHVMLFDKDNTELLATYDGTFIEELGLWNFTIPGEATKGRLGRHWYRICTPEASLCFRQPIYFCV